MKHYKVKTLRTFNDGLAKKTRTVDDVFTVDEERLDALKKASSPLVEVMAEKVPEDTENTEENDIQKTEEATVENLKETGETEKTVEIDVPEDAEEEEREEANLNVKALEDKTEYPLHVGGPYYLLSNGEKVKGKKAAAKAEKEM